MAIGQMRYPRTAAVACAATMLAGLMLLGGCRVESKNTGDGKDVNIVTPFGGMSVKTNDQDVLAQIGLPAYPGAIAVNKDDDQHHSADVDMSFGGFKLKVKVASFRSDDGTDKVEAYYRGKMKQFGDVLTCRNHAAVGTPAKTAEGLTCDNNHGGHISVDDRENSRTVELRAGSEQNQHIVTLDPDGGGTRFSLVALDLPGKFNIDGGSDDTRQ